MPLPLQEEAERQQAQREQQRADAKAFDPEEYRRKYERQQSRRTLRPLTRYLGR